MKSFDHVLPLQLMVTWFGFRACICLFPQVSLGKVENIITHIKCTKRLPPYSFFFSSLFLFFFFNNTVFVFRWISSLIWLSILWQCSYSCRAVPLSKCTWTDAKLKQCHKHTEIIRGNERLDCSSAMCYKWNEPAPATGLLAKPELTKRQPRQTMSKTRHDIWLAARPAGRNHPLDLNFQARRS